MTAHRVSVSQLSKAAVRPAFHLIRALPVYAAGRRLRGCDAKVAFLPAYGQEGAALLRIYTIATALRSLGWGVLVLPSWMRLAERRRALAVFAPDIVVMQGVRHALNRPVLYRPWRVVLDMDDADFHLDHLAAPVRRVMGQVVSVITGSKYVADWCLGAGAPAAHVVWTGTEVSKAPRPPASARGPVIAWAQTRPMTYGDEARFVADVMRRLAARRPGVTLRLYDRCPGDDPTFLSQFEAPGLTVTWKDKMAYADYLASFDDVALGLAPLCMEAPFTRGKSFGKVLAYLDRKVPVIGSDAGEHGRFFTPDTGVISNDPETWVRAMDHLLGHAEMRQTMADAAFEAFQRRLSIEAAARATDRILQNELTVSELEGRQKTYSAASGSRW